MKSKDVFMYVLGGIVSIGFFAVLVFLIWKGENPTDVSLIIGSLIGAFSMVISYFFGSSKGSADKSELMKK